MVSFDWMVPDGSSGFSLRAVVEAANDSDTSNNAANLELSYTDAEITGVYNELYTENNGFIYVDVKNTGYSNIEKATVCLSTDEGFENIIGTKEINNLNILSDKRVVFDLEASDEQIAGRARIYAKVEVGQSEFNYFNNSDFTIIRPCEWYLGDLEPGEVEDPKEPEDPEDPSEPEGSEKPQEPEGPKDPGSPQDLGNPVNPQEPEPQEPQVPQGPQEPQEPVIEPSPDIPSTGKNSKAYMRGYGDNTFKPEQNLTRAEMAVILANLDGASKADSGNVEFKDVPKEHWAAWAISYVYEKGYFKGYEDGSYKPDKNITRAELCVVLSNYMDMGEANEDDSKLTDIEGHWAQKFINKLISEGYVKGYPDNTFRPNNNIKRSECVTLINRVLGIEPIKDAENHFSDVDKNHWAFGDIMAATMSE